MVHGKKKKKKVYEKIDTEPVRLYIQQKGRCYYCHQLMKSPLHNPSNGRVGPKNSTIEHLYPKTDIRRFCKGGNDAKVLACAKCNNLKGAIDGIVNSEYSRELTKPYKGLLIKLLKNENYG
jgi:hypothetical protein